MAAHTNWCWITDRHGSWLCIPMKELQASEIRPGRYSHISDDGKLAYLDSIIDATNFLEAVGFPLSDINEIDEIGVKQFNRKLKRFPHPQVRMEV